MKINRHFVGWNAPLLPTVAGELVATYGNDLSCFDVVLPGSRAGRRFLDLLLKQVESSHQILIPPTRILSPGDLPELCYVSELKIASKTERLFAWQAALSHVPEQDLKRLITGHSVTHLGFRLTLAERFDSLWNELSGAEHCFADVAKAVMQLNLFRESERWQLLQSLYEDYQKILANHGSIDRNAARNKALTEDVQIASQVLLLIGAIDITALAKTFIKRGYQKVESYIHAPEGQSEGFDAFGCVKEEHWIAQSAPLQSKQIRIGERPADQVGHAITFLSEHSDNYAADAVTIVAADNSLIPYVSEECAARNLPLHVATGRGLIETEPVRLLQLCCHYQTTRSIQDFSNLVKHLHFEQFLAAKGVALDIPELRGIVHYVPLIDACIEAHLPESVQSIAEFSETGILQTLLTIVDETTKPLARIAGELSDWAKSCALVLDTIYSDIQHLENGAFDRTTVESCMQVAAFLSEIALSTVEKVSVEKLSAIELFQVFCRLLQGAEVAQESLDQAIELIGWLELAMDDAPVVFVAGLNEGIVPESLNGDSFLPNSLRETLSLLTNDKRLARDMFLLTALLHSREHVQVSYGKKTAQGDFMLPSRLILQTKKAEMAARILTFAEHTGGQFHHRAITSAAKESPGKESELGYPYPPDLNTIEIPRSLSVSAFQSYLLCPYRFYLKHLLQLERRSDAGSELPATLYGTIAHAVLDRFGSSSAKDETDAARIVRSLEGHLRDVQRETLGSRPGAFAVIQLEMLRTGLHLFAHHQAAWRADGWRIIQVEKSYQREHAFQLRDGTFFGVHGRIDRIDEHERTGESVVIDYKTGVQEDPVKNHYAKGMWRNLQFPLYNHLLSEQVPSAKLHACLVQLPRSIDDNCFYQFDEKKTPTMEEGISLATEIAQKIHDGVFWPPAQDFDSFDEYAEICSAKMFSELTYQEDGV